MEYILGAIILCAYGVGFIAFLAVFGKKQLLIPLFVIAILILAATAYHFMRVK